MNFKNIRKQIASLLILVLTLSMAPAIGFAEVVDAPVSKTINVAKHKPTTSSHPASDYAKVVDDDFHAQNNAWHIGGSYYTDNPDAEKTSPWVKIDLLRSYDIEKIVLYDRADSTQAMRSKFELYGTNDPDATEEDWEKIFFAADDASLTDNLAAAFPANGCYVVPVTDKNYRYIIYKSTNSYYCSVREIQVFANVKATEISRGTASTSMAGSYPGKQTAAGDIKALTDGNLDNDFYSGQNTSKYTFLTFDLGQEYNIDLLEINAIARLAGTSLYENIGFYGSNTQIADYTATYGDTGKAYESLDAATFLTAISATKLGSHPTYMKDTVYSDKDGNFVYQQIWTKDAVNTSDRIPYYLTFNSDEKYRYLTIRKENLNTRLSASEITAYMIHPEVFAGSLDGRELTVSFSEKMDISSLEGGNVYALIGDDEYELDVEEGELDNEYVFTIPEVYETDVDIYFDTNVCSEKGVYLAEEHSLTVTTGKAVDTGNAGFTDADAENESELPSLPQNEGDIVNFKLDAVNNSTSPKSVVLILAVYDADNQIKQIKVEKYDLAVSPVTVSLSVKLALEEASEAGDYAQVNVWDSIDNATSMFDMLKLE